MPISPNETLGKRPPRNKTGNATNHGDHPQEWQIGDK